MYPPEKNTKQLTVRGGGGNPYGQPDRKISVFFFLTTFQLLFSKNKKVALLQICNGA